MKSAMFVLPVERMMPQPDDLFNQTQELKMTRSTAILTVVSSSNIERTPRAGQLRLAATSDAVAAGNDTAGNTAPSPRCSLLSTVGRFLAPNTTEKNGERINADFWDQRHMS
jgi:hypothetical protein